MKDSYDRVAELSEEIGYKKALLDLRDIAFPILDADIPTEGDLYKLHEDLSYRKALMDVITSLTKKANERFKDGNTETVYVAQKEEKNNETESPMPQL